MNLDKSDVKIQAANELGCRLDDLLEGSQKDQLRCEGSVTSFKGAASAIEGLMKVVDQEMDEGRFDLTVAGHIKRFMGRAHQMMINMAMNAENLRLMQMGKIQAYEQAVGSVKKFRDEEMVKASQLRLAAEEALKKSKGGGANGSSPAPLTEEQKVETGHPGLSIKAQRLAEEAVEQTKTVDPPTPPKKRGRPPKRQP